MSNLKDKIVIITGASSGLGQGAALEFARLGAKLSISGRNVENLQATVSQCEKAGLPAENILSLQADLTKDDDVKKVVDETIKKFGQLDVLVNNAGIVKPGGIETQSMEDYDYTMNINVRCHFYMTKLAVPHLIKTKGSILNVSSVNGMRAFPGVISYCMSKAAIDQFTRCCALELAQKGVRVNSVNPGVIMTEIHKRGGMDEAAYAKFLEHSKTTHAMGRVGQPVEVAKAIVFLASSDSSFITGASIPIDGGRHAMCPR
ncbi:3-oxoacyl-[acyl-carrier-protein] reductase FabG-like isoform X2 [Lineus longissimus]|uniref:3-oxoacyl-[acyl-carrier-protein] reductase FabG-like isoform X2 n=1 Tax=Lineus longissimus TaxID=88925 RepID=UPI00315DCC71